MASQSGRRIQARFPGVAFLGLGVIAGIQMTAVDASADQIIVGKNTTDNYPAVYRKAANGTCSKTLPYPYDYIYGTDSDDVIFVHTNPGTISWCGFSIGPIATIPNILNVMARKGADVVWVEDTNRGWINVDPAADAGCCDDSDNIVYAGSAGRVYGGDFKDTILVPGATQEVKSGDGNDLICTKVSDVFTNHNAGVIRGGLGSDSRYGPAAATEISVENKGSSSSACDLVYVYAALTVLNMLGE